MKNIAIIPARGGSKRIPRKNIKDFLGKPIIAYSIELALKSALFKEVMVSTDDDKIAEIAKEYGANVPFKRSKESADDYAGLSDVVYEVLDDYKKKKDAKFDNIACILPTAPLINIKRLKEGYDLLIRDKFSSVTPVIAFSYPILRSLKFNNNKHLVMNWSEYLTSRSQDLPEAYHDSGMFYWIDYNNFMQEKKLFSENGTGLILNETEVQDIDNEIDWKLAELKYKMIHE